MYSYKKEKENGGSEKKDGRLKRKKRRAEHGDEQNTTGIPTPLKERMETHTGLSLDDVRVHYHSDMPKRLDALAYTQGNQVYIGAGQEQHLPHELGHVIQQKLGRVRADTRHESGAPMNTDASLEREADEIGALRKTVEKRTGSGGRIVQRKIEPESDRMDDGALISAVRNRMRKNYKTHFGRELIRFYSLIKRSSYSFTNDEILTKIVEADWNKKDTAKLLAAEMERKKQEELDLMYGGERGHMVSRHIEISEEELRARVEGNRGIARASKFAPGIKGRDQALHTLDRLQPILAELLKSLLQMTGVLLVQNMAAIQEMNAARVKKYLSDVYGIDFDTMLEERQDEFVISYQHLLQKRTVRTQGGRKMPAFMLSVDYSVTVERIFQKQVVEKERPKKIKRVYEDAEVFRGRDKPGIQVTPETKEEEIDGLVEAAGIDVVGVTFY